jgi:hypothetical protein
VHETEVQSSQGIYGTAALIFDRSSWMSDHLDTLGGMALQAVALPASHDAGMYTGDGFGVLGKTQDLDAYGQLLYGVRYFDFRPDYQNGDFVMYHNFSQVTGASLASVLSGAAKFFSAGTRELAIFKFSHWGSGFTQDVFNLFCQRLQDPATGLGNWLYYPSRPLSPRLANRSVGELLGASGGTVLVVLDFPYNLPPEPPASGLFRYGDWYAKTPSAADLTVFDNWSDTTDMDTMKTGMQADENLAELGINGIPDGQLPKFSGPGWTGFNGTCYFDASTPCDLFLLSWTLTPTSAVFSYSRDPNSELVDDTSQLGANSFGKTLNMLFTDYAEYSRSTDEAMVRNGLTP